MSKSAESSGWRECNAMIVFLDSNVVIYYIECDPYWGPKVEDRLRKIAANNDTLATSDAVRLETLIGPFQSGDIAVLADYQKFFNSSGIQMLPVTAAVWEQAARIRAGFKLPVLDSIHLATAIEHGCGLFLTNDLQLANFEGMKVEVLT
jgi:predicted nucleic acid-binding protein